MAMIDIQWNPGARELRQFSVLFLVFGCGLTTYWLWGDLGSTLALSLYGVSVAVGVLGLAVPPLVKPVFLTLTLISFPIGMVVSYVLLLVVYYVVLTPIGLLLRVMGKDPMSREIDKKRESYWVERPAPAEVKRYFQQY